MSNQMIVGACGLRTMLITAQSNNTSRVILPKCEAPHDKVVEHSLWKACSII